MLSDILKEATKDSHARAERKVMERLKTIKNEQDYAEFLKLFYTLFKGVEDAIYPYLMKENPSLIADRRDASVILDDIHALGYHLEEDQPTLKIIPVQSMEAAVGMLYVLEGSTLGGVYIVRMLQKLGIERGLSFFEGYGGRTQERWQYFKESIDKAIFSTAGQQEALQHAEEAFESFGNIWG